MLTGVRRSSCRRSAGATSTWSGVLRVRESKIEEGERSIALSPTLADVLAGSYRRTAYQGDDELVFCHPDAGHASTARVVRAKLRAALTAAGITDYVRPFHDLRHASLTNEPPQASRRSR